MFSIVVIAAVCAFAVAQPAAEVDSPIVRVCFTACAMASVVIVATFTNVLRLSATQTADREDDVHLWDLVNLATWALMSLFCVQAMRWPAMVRAAMGEPVPLVDECAILFSFLLPLFLAWMILWQPARQGAGLLRLRECVAAAWLRMRFTFVLTLLPLLLVCGATDCIAQYWPEMPASQRAAVYVGCLIGVTAFFPVAIRALWTARSLSQGDLRCRLLTMASRHRVRLTDICIWHTGGIVANAFVTGIIAPMRYVFLTDRLLSELEEDHIVLAFAHELGHVVKRHLILRALALLVPLAILIILSHLIGSPTALGGTHGELASPGLVFELSSASLTVLFMVLGLGWYSRQLEHQADLWACQVGAGAATLDEEVERYSLALIRLVDPRHFERNGWLHPGYQQRRRFLRECVSDPCRASAFSARMKWLAAALYLLTASALALLAASVWFGRLPSS